MIPSSKGKLCFCPKSRSSNAMTEISYRDYVKCSNLKEESKSSSPFSPSTGKEFSLGSKSEDCALIVGLRVTMRIVCFWFGLGGVLPWDVILEFLFCYSLLSSFSNETIQSDIGVSSFSFLNTKLPIGNVSIEK